MTRAEWLARESADKDWPPQEREGHGFCYSVMNLAHAEGYARGFDACFALVLEELRSQASSEPVSCNGTWSHVGPVKKGNEWADWLETRMKGDGDV